jgi:hypothetical protein
MGKGTPSLASSIESDGRPVGRPRSGSVLATLQLGFCEMALLPPRVAGELLVAGAAFRRRTASRRSDHYSFQVAPGTAVCGLEAFS